MLNNIVKILLSNNFINALNRIAKICGLRKSFFKKVVRFLEIKGDENQKKQYFDGTGLAFLAKNKESEKEYKNHLDVVVDIIIPVFNGYSYLVNLIQNIYAN